MSTISDPPGTSAICRCFTLLELLEDYPEGPFTDIFASFDSAGGYGVQAKDGYTLKRWPWCPGCGGKLGKYRPELVEARSRYHAAVTGPYAPLLKGRQDPAAFRAGCEGQGARVVTDQDMWLELHDAAASLRVGAQWDPDHDCWYSYGTFAPREELLQRPFVPDPELR
jgi:hypothetical protein